MSTTFGIKINKEVLRNPYMKNPEDFSDSINEDEIITPIAFRSGGIRFTNPIAHLLPDELEVIPMDNSAQGIETIGDIKSKIIKY